MGGHVLWHKSSGSVLAIDERLADLLCKCWSMSTERCVVGRVCSWCGQVQFEAVCSAVVVVGQLQHRVGGPALVRTSHAFKVCGWKGMCNRSCNFTEQPFLHAPVLTAGCEARRQSVVVEGVHLSLR